MAACKSAAVAQLADCGPPLRLPAMSLAYRLMYLVGFTPWDTEVVPPELAALVEGEEASPPGRALDVGCGTGTQAVYLAREGWRVTAIDVVEKPLRRARARAAAAGVAIDFRRADAGRLAEAGLRPGFDLVLDRGCFHGLSAHQRTAYADAVTDLAAPQATLLLMAFARHGVRFGPTGADSGEIASAFSGWELRSCEPDRGRSPAGPMRDVPLYWYRLARA